MNGRRDSTCEDKDYYENIWRRQKKNYKIEIMLLIEKLTQMQEKLDSLQQRQLQGGIGKGRNAIMKSKFNKFGRINVETILGFCKNKMKVLDQPMLLCLSNK